MQLDWRLYSLLNGLAGRSPALDTIIRLLMNDYLMPTALVLCTFGLWFVGKSPTSREHNQRGVLSAATSILLVNLVIKAVNLVVYRYRPFAFHQVNLLFYYPSDSSFPSNAAGTGFAVATAVWLVNRRMGWLLFVFASLFGIARVSGGVHYPGDIVGGALIGMCCSYLIVRKAPLLDQLWSWTIRFLRRLLLA